jgi:O-antigen/teichoic acid export membrane protein
LTFAWHLSRRVPLRQQRRYKWLGDEILNSGCSLSSPPSTARRVHSLKLGAAAQVLRLFAAYGVSLLTTPYVVSRLGLHDFGIWSVTGAFAQSAVMLDLGVARACDRYVAVFHVRGDIENERCAVGVCMTVLASLGLVLFGVALLITTPLDHFLKTGDPALARILVLSAVTMLLCGMFARGLAGASFGRGRQVGANAGLAVFGAAQAIAGVVALVVSPTLRSFALGSAAGAVLGLGAVIVAILIDERRIVIGRPKAALAREMMSYGIIGQARGVADIVMIQSPKLIAGALIGPEAAGIYELGSRLAQGAVTFGSATSEALFVHLTRAYALGGEADIVAQYSRLTRRNAAVTIFLPLILCATSISVIPLWLGAPRHGVVIVLAVLGAATTVRMATNVCTTSYLAMGRVAILGATTMASAAFSVALAFPLAHAFGLNGIVAAFGCGIVVGSLVSAWFLQAQLGISMTEFLRAIKGPFALGIVATVAALPIGLISMPHDRPSALIPFLLSGVIFCAIYAFVGRKRDYLPRFFGGWQ